MSLASRNRVFTEFCDLIYDFLLATIQTVCRSVRCRCWECRPTVAEGGQFEHVRARGVFTGVDERDRTPSRRQ